MKQNIFLASLLLLISMAGVAQNRKSKVDFGIKAGFNFTGVTIKDVNDKYVTDNKIKTGVYAGFYADIPLGSNWFFQPGLGVSNKGVVHNDPAQKTTISATYAEVPLHFIYKSKGQDGGFFIGAGAYAAYGLGGVVKERANGYSESSIQFAGTSKVNFDYSKNRFYLKPIDAGLSFLMGFETKSRLLFQVSAQAGIFNQSLKTPGVEFYVSKYKNYGAGIGFGYRF